MLGNSCISTPSAASTSEAPARRKAPFHVLYSNDTTNVVTCISPFHHKGEKFNPEMLRASVDESIDAGSDAQLLQPGTGWVPWWNSQTYPYPEHIRFMKERFDLAPSDDDFAAYMAAKGDIVGIFVQECRKKGAPAFISLRLNDGHGLEYAQLTPKKFPGFIWHTLSRFYVEHLDWRVGPDPNDWYQHVLDWSIPDVRNRKLDFIREIAKQYDIDGFELDFMRHCSFFKVAETTTEQRREIMTNFLRDVRRILDNTAPAGKRRWLCVRIPEHLAPHDAMGIDVGSMAGVGVDMFNLSGYYFLQQQSDMAKIRAMAPNTAIYLEMCHTTKPGPIVGTGGYDNFTFRRTTPAQYYTAAHLAYARGLDGVSLFNFAYYREHGAKEAGPFNEPPFEVIKHLNDPAWLAKQPQHYILAHVWDDPPTPRQIARTYTAGSSYRYDLDMAPPEEGWKKGGRLRIQCETNLGDSKWEATLNGVPLKETNDRSEPYSPPYPALLGTPEQHRAWVVPPQALKNGVNSAVVKMDSGESPAKLVFLDYILD